MRPLWSELTEVFQLPIPTELPAGWQQFAANPSLGAHKSRYPQNTKGLLAGSNSSKRGLTVRGMFMPSDQTWE